MFSKIADGFGDSGAIILFVAFFLLYGLEFFFPLVRRKSKHLISNILSAGMLSVVNLSFTSITFLTASLIERHQLGLFQNVPASTGIQILVSVVFLDFWAGYLVHFLHHRFAWLWQLHSVHHSDDLVDVTTTFRQHPGESIIRIAFHLSGMLILGIPVWILLIYLTLSTIHAQLEHANIKLPARADRLLQLIFVTPNMHKVHHSRYQHETDSNYSNILSVWDRLFQTFRSRRDYHSIDYGLDYLENGRHYSFYELIKLPFREAPPKNKLRAKKRPPGLSGRQKIRKTDSSY